MKIKKTIFLVILSIFLLNGAFFVNSLQAQEYNPLEGLDETAGAVKAFKTQTGANANYDNFLQTKAGQIIGTVLSFVGVLFLVLMIYAGILWMTAQGNETQVAKAKNLLMNGIIGLIIVFSAYAITSFIGNEILN
ncbi:MAG: Type secretion system pilin [Patescibacteria group bacterium]|nr:Type secretion system pilin [Patescibacteria group bacterium]